MPYRRLGRRDTIEFIQSAIKRVNQDSLPVCRAVAALPAPDVPIPRGPGGSTIVSQQLQVRESPDLHGSRLPVTLEMHGRIGADHAI